MALDQPTIVRNATSMRAAERAAASLISWLGGGVQPLAPRPEGRLAAAGRSPHRL
jgi:predicted RNase H-like nuclease